jgi:alpha-D-ribose 1-methylphosphonate 5-triphosphate synthase subunit PhnG
MMQSPNPSAAPDASDLIARRQGAMAICAEASSHELEAALDAVGFDAPVQDLRRSETGLVMVRGRIGCDGGPFNFGEATVTRAAVRLPCGTGGFSYQLGRDVKKARLAATLDALIQTAHAGAVEAALAPVRARLADERATRARRTAATRVNFFTLARGED